MPSVTLVILDRFPIPLCDRLPCEVCDPWLPRDREAEGKIFSSSDAVDGGENVLDRLLRRGGSSGDHLKLLPDAFEPLLPIKSGEVESPCSGTGASFDLDRDSVSFRSRGPDRPMRRT